MQNELLFLSCQIEDGQEILLGSFHKVDLRVMLILSGLTLNMSYVNRFIIYKSRPRN